MSSRSGSSSSTRSEPSQRSNSTSPKVPRKVGGASERDSLTTRGNGTLSHGRDDRGRAISRGSSSASQLEGGRKLGSGGSRKTSSTTAVGHGSREGEGTRGTGEKSSAKTLPNDVGRQSSTRGQAGDEGKRNGSVVERKSSPLTQRRMSPATTASSAKRSSSGGGGKLKSPTQSSPPGRTTSLPRVSADKTVKEEKKTSPGSTRKVTSGKPPTGANSTGVGRTGVKQSVTNGGTGRNAGREKPVGNGGPAKSSSETANSSAGERVRNSSAGGSVTAGKKTAAAARKGGGGRESPAAGGERKLSAERRLAGSKSAGNSPATVRRAGSMTKSPGSSPVAVRRSSTLRRISSSGSIPVPQRPPAGRDRKAESVSPKIDRRGTAGKKARTATPSTSPGKKTAGNAAIKSDGRTTNVGEKKTTSPGTGRRTAVESATTTRKVPGEKKTGAEKQSSAAGFNPAGRHSLRSRSEINLESRKGNSQSLGRKISASAVGRGSPSPSTLAGKTIILDHTHLQNEEKLQSTLKHFGVKGGPAGVKKASRGPVIKAMGVATSSGRSTPVGHSVAVGRAGRSSAATGRAVGMARTGSGSTIPSRSAAKSSGGLRTRLRSTDDILKSGQDSPAETAEKVRVTSPLSMATVAPSPETQSEPEKKAVDKDIEEASDNSKASDKTDEDSKASEKADDDFIASDKDLKTSDKASDDLKTSEKTSEDSKTAGKDLKTSEKVGEDFKASEKAEEDLKISEEAGEELKASEKFGEEYLKTSEKAGENVKTSKKNVNEERLLKKPTGAVRGMVSRPSCRNTQVKSKIASWKKMEEEAKKIDSRSSLSPVPSSPRLPLTSSPHAFNTPPKVSSPPAPLSPSHSHSERRSQSPTVISNSGTPVKSRIALWEKEREGGDVCSSLSLSPQRSPTHSPTSSPSHSPPRDSPRGLKRQSPVDKRRMSPMRSAASGGSSSREGSVESNTQSLANSREDASPARQLPAITVGREEASKQAGVTPQELTEQTEEGVYEDVETSPKRKLLPSVPASEQPISAPPTVNEEAIYSTIPEVSENVAHGSNKEAIPNLPARTDSMKVQEGEIEVVDIEDEEAEQTVPQYTRPAPVYTEIDIIEEPKAAEAETAQSLAGVSTPKSKRRWLPSPRFGRRKSSNDDKEPPSEGPVASDKEEKKGFMKKIARIGSRSAKERQAIKRKSGEMDSDSSSSPEDGLQPANSARARSSSQLGSDQLLPEAIPRSNSYSPAASSDAGYGEVSRKYLDPSSQRVVSANQSSAEVSPAHEGSVSGSSVGRNGSSDQLLARPKAVDGHRKSAPPPQRGLLQPGASDGASGLPHDLRTLIDSLGEGLEFCEAYSKKVSSLPGTMDEKQASGSAPGGLRLPVPFDLNHGSSHPNLVSVGFQLPPGEAPAGEPVVPNGVAGERSDSSTASEGEEPASSEKDEEEEGDVVYPIESSLDHGRHTRYDIKRKLSEGADKLQAVDQAPDNLVVTSLMYADAVWDRVGLDNDELSFRVGDVIEILDMSDDTWWQGSVQEQSGWFPSSFVRLRIAQEEEEEDMYAVPPDADQIVGGTLPRVSTMPAGDSSYATYGGRSSNSKRRMTIRRKDSCPSMPRKLTPTEVRSKVVEEILNTERDYVKHLEDIIEGFLKKCYQNKKLFDQEKVETIFSNLESLYQFQQEFLRQLEARIIPHSMEESQIGEVFVSCRKGFEVYSEYCNNHPHAVNEMCLLQKKEQYAFFFESCRLLRNLQNIPLEGFLLLPVQKICKYPLQLSELLKYTSEDHPDRGGVEAAVEAMRQVATHINEGKRRLENIGRIGKWQDSIDGWKGPDILETSTEMIHSSELHKISKGHSQERHFFLFDNQLIYCKKDAIGGRLSYKGRLSMEKCHVTDIPDGQETHNGVPVRNAWKMDNKAKGKDYIIFAKSPEVKMKWMEAFQREKERVAQDRDTGFHVSLKMKRAAAALCSSTAAVTAAKRRKSFNKKQVLRVHTLSESVDSAVKVKIDGSPARERKGKFSRMKQIF